MLGPKTNLVLQHYTKVPDGMGGFELVYQCDRKIRGVLISLSGNERFVAGKTEVYRTHKFMMDYPKGLTITEIDKFTLGARKFNIRSVKDPAEQHRHLEIELLEIT